MIVETMGEAAFLVRELSIPASDFARNLGSLHLAGIDEVVSAYDTAAIYVQPDQFTLDLTELRKAETVALATDQRVHRVPICFDLDSDLVAIADLLALDTLKVTRAFLESTYECAAIGFCPGFPYLRGLPEALTGVPRLPSPRTSTPIGAVAITGAQAGIYPLPRPGGWRILGYTPLTIVDVATNFFPIQSGDRLIFREIGAHEYRTLLGERL